MPEIAFTILVVDDNPDTLSSTTRILRSARWNVVEARTGAQGIEMAKGDIDLVILETNLPDIDGYEVSRSIRAVTNKIRFPVIHLSGTCVKTSSRSHSFELGSDGYLTHPVEPQVLIATVGAFLRARKAEIDREELLVSERAARMEAERANRFKDEFLATLSHELRTPLQAIIGWSQLLKVGNHSRSDFIEGLDAIEDNAQSQSQMIADLLDVSRIDSGKLRLDPRPVELNEVIEAVLGSILPVASSRGITLGKSIDLQPAQVIGDTYRLRQVIWNLLNNAIKFTPDHGQVEIRLHQVGGHAEISVIDNGKGIEPSLLSRIFDRFYQGDNSSTSESGGLGLGLAIARQLVELHGGSIHAQSEGPGKGATFLVSIPLAPERRDGMKAPDMSEKNWTQNVNSLEDLRILIVDDDPDTRRMLTRILAGSGAITKECDGVQQALDSIEGFQPHVLVSDLGMPGKDGYELIQTIRSMGDAYQDLPAIALTAFARAEDRQRALISGFQVHVPKPVDLRKLTSTIARLTGRATN